MCPFSNIINPIDPCGGAQDIYEIKRKYGDKIAISGNINIEKVLLHGTPDQVKQDVIEHIDGCAKSGGYIVSSSHNLHELIPVETIMRSVMQRTLINLSAKVYLLT